MMSQRHSTIDGTFHVTTNAHGKIPWCTLPGVPEILIDNLIMTRNVYGAILSAFCILPDHMHMIVWPGEKGLAKFVQSFKSHSSHDVKAILTRSSEPWLAAAEGSTLKFTGWQKGYHDERLRDNEQRTNALRYVTMNPVKHNLVNQIEDWPWTSLHFEHLLDPLEIWLD